MQAFSQFKLEKVLYVPEFLVNLLSISAITKQLLCYVTFFPFHCIFQDLRTRKKISLDRERDNGMYLLVSDDIPQGLASVASTFEPSFLWHYQLGHPFHQKLQQALPWVSVSSFDYESCQLGKHHRTSFRHLRLVSSPTLFELVHCDIQVLPEFHLCLFITIILFLLIIFQEYLGYICLKIVVIFMMYSKLSLLK